MAHLLKIIVLILYASVRYCDSASIPEVVQGLWRKFWSSSCEFSSDVSRSRRSLNFPNVQDPDDFFHYLYPSLHLTPEDVESGRSMYFTSWLDDFVEFWEVECHVSKASARDDEGEPDEMEHEADANATIVTASGNQVSNSSYALKNYAKDTSSRNATIISNSTALGKETKQAGSSIPDILSTLETIFPALNIFKPRQPVNTFFAQYGGDLEYFFPVWGWGIPFDGEITFLGFHGFKGLFPYRR